MKGEFINGDCMEYLPKYEDNHFDLAIVDPPYGIGMAKWDLKPDKKYFNELIKVSKNYIIWGANYFNLQMTESWLCWHKTHGFKNRALNGQSDFELGITSFNHKARLIPLTHSGNITGFDNKVVDYKYKPIHPTQKPIALYKWLLKNYAKEGDLILDTHVGSASSLIACEDMGFKYVGYELDKDYYESAMKRLKNHIAQLKIF